MITNFIIASWALMGIGLIGVSVLSFIIFKGVKRARKN
jgi:hypothetical protein